MSLWNQFGPEDPVKTQERILAAIQFQDEQLSRVTDPILTDIADRLETQEQALRSVYRPITSHIKKDVMLQKKHLGIITNRIKTDVQRLQAEQGLALRNANLTSLTGDTAILPTDPPVICSPPSACYDVNFCTLTFDRWASDVSDMDGDIWTCYMQGESVPGPDGPVYLWRCSRAFVSLEDGLRGCEWVMTLSGALLHTCVLSCTDKETDNGGDDGKIEDPPPPPPTCPPPQLACPAPNVIVNVPECPAPPKPEKPKPDEIGGVDPDAGESDGSQPLWEPDTEVICETITGYIQRWGAIGQAYMDALTQTTRAGSTVTNEGESLGNLLLQAIVPIAGIISPSRIMESIRQTVSNLSNSITGNMIAQGTAYVGLQIIRIVLDTLESVQVGWNLGPLVAVSLRISLNKERQVLDYLQNFLWPTSIPSSSEINLLWQQKEISDRHADCLWRMNSSLPRLQKKVVRAGRSQISPIDIVRLWQRQPYDKNLLLTRLAQVNFQEESDVRELITTQQFIPPPGDSISFAVKDVFDPQLPGRVLMQGEYQSQRGLDALFRANGIGPVQITGISPGTNDIVDIGLMYWFAHYQHCSPTQVYEMLHRLRPNRVAKWSLPGQTPQEIAAMTTTIDDVRRLLKLNDYNPFWRDKLAAIAYRPIGRIDARRFYDLNIFGPALGRGGIAFANGVYTLTGVAERELGEVYLDMGYSSDDASKLAAFTAYDFDRRKLAPQREALKRQVCESIKLGIGQVPNLVQMLINAGVTQQEANSLVQQCEFARTSSLVKRSIRYIKRALLGGRINKDVARVLLNQLGLNPVVIGEHINEWSLDFAMRAKEPQAQELCSWFGQGLLTLQEFQSRLSGIGYAVRDQERIIAVCQGGINARRAKELEKIQRILDKQKREKERRDREALRRFLSSRTDKNLKDWFKEGVINKDDIVRTLRLRGWDEMDIQRWIQTNLS